MKYCIQITKFKLLFSILSICFNSFFNFLFSECLFCISVSIIKVLIFHLSLKLPFFSDMFTLANVGVSRSFLHVLMYLISALTLINVLCVFSSDRITVIISCPCFFFTYLKTPFLACPKRNCDKYYLSETGRGIIERAADHCRKDKQSR